MNGDRNAWDEAYRQRGQLWGGAVTRLPDLPGHARVLELGCGNGKTLKALARRGWETVALDYSVAAVTTARQHLREPSECHCMVADARAIPLRPASVDAVFAWHVLGHLNRTERQQAVREISRLLVPGGKIFFSGFSAEDFRFGRGTETEAGTFCRGNAVCTHYFTGPEVLFLFDALTCVSLVSHRWSLRIRGQDHQRAEIRATFMTSPGS